VQSGLANLSVCQRQEDQEVPQQATGKVLHAPALPPPKQKEPP